MNKPPRTPAADPAARPPRPDNGRRRVVIAGLGLITPLGDGAWPTFRALLAGRSIADRATNLPPGIDPVALARAVGGVAICRHSATDPAVELAERAAREAAAEAGVALQALPTWLGTSKGAVGAMGRDPLAGALGPHGYLSHHLMRRTALAVRCHAVAACASSLYALHQAHRWLSRAADTHGRPPQALVLTAEAALTPLFLHSYRRLGVLADPTPTGYRERPLHSARRGFMLTEIGAAVLLRALPPDTPPRDNQTELVASAAACEAGDLIRPSPTMDALRHVAGSLLAHGRPDVLHPHAPGTPDHDQAEWDVLRDVLAGPDQDAPPPDVYAVKGALGHGLGAAGLASLVVAALCLRTGRRPPMPWLDDPLPGLGPAPHEGRTLGGAASHAVFAAGFGGHTAGALIRRGDGFPPMAGVT